MEQTPATRHRLIPATLVASQVPIWIEKNSKETFKHTVKVYFSPEELDDKARRSCKAGVIMLGLDDIMSQVKKYCEDGLSEEKEPIILELRPTAGNKSLKKTRAFLDKEVSLGYEEVTTQVYGIPDADTEMMICVTADGIEVPERSRPLSPKEKHDYIGLYMRRGSVSDGDGTMRAAQ